MNGAMPDQPPLPGGVRIRARRRIVGLSAVLLPVTPSGEPDWEGFAAHVTRTVEAGLIPAVNMDTGYVQLLPGAERRRVLQIARERAPAGFAAGAQFEDAPGQAFAPEAYLAQIERVQAHGGTPVLFPSHGLNSLEPDDWIAAHARLARDCDRFIAFELAPAFVPCGRIYPAAAFAGLLEIPQCVGAKHSSLSRALEWERLALRDRLRPEFQVLTGNDLAIDMVMYGSDYLLGLSTFAPDLFARRDALWEAGDPDFYELNDRLQYLGQFAFRAPVPAYKHDAAIFLKLRGQIGCDAAYPGAPTRPAADADVLAEIAERLAVLP